MFDAEAFMGAAVEPLSTQFEVIPEGEWPFLIDTDPRQLADTTEDNVQIGIKHHSGVSEKSGKPYDFYDWTFTCITTDPRVLQKLGRNDRATVRMRINLDLDEAGRLATGPNKNVRLGQLRDALGQNTAGWTPKQLLGAGPFMGKVSHTVTDKGTFADITRVAKIA